MPQFPIDWRINFLVGLDERNRHVLKRKLDDERTIVCVLTWNQARFQYKMKSIEISRKKASGAFLVTGALVFDQNERRLWKKECPRMIEPTNFYTEILSNIGVYIDNDSYYRLYGFLDISELASPISTNENFKKWMCLKSLEDLSKRETVCCPASTSGLLDGEYKEKTQWKSLEDVSEGGTVHTLASASDLSDREHKEKIQWRSLEDLSKGESKEEILLKSIENLSNDFERLLEPDASCFADVTLKCGGFSIPAHKNILSARSPVFAAMFQHPMKESYRNEVDITDIEVSVLRALLTYLYTGKTSDLTTSSAGDLLFAADKYQLQDLKRMCSFVLKDNVSLQNVLKMLVLGDMHAEDLKLFAIEYICKVCAGFSVLERTEEWKTLQKERPSLAMDVLIALVKSKENKKEKG